MPIANAQRSIFEEGRNCRRVADAGRVAFIVDGDDYFKMFMAAAERARESIIVIAWDFNSNCCLNVECDSKDPRAKLGEYLNDLARRRRGLHIYVLDWDFPMIYAKDREAPVDGAARVGLETASARSSRVRQYASARRVAPSEDRRHRRCDRVLRRARPHLPALGHARACSLTSRTGSVADQPYPPFHDLMIAVDGEAARELGRIARERWRASTEKEIPPVRASDDPWPPDLEPALTNLPVAIAVTAPESAPHQGKREVEALYLDMIARAQRYIYIENQYFTAH